MILLFLLVLLLVIVSSSVRQKNGWKDSYISISQSHSIEGIFVLLIFMGHVVRYFVSFNALDIPFLAVKEHLDQAVVAMFLFYSGFGMTQSLKKKGADYLNKIPLKRFLPLLIKYEIVTLIFLTVRLFIGNIPDTKNLILSFTGWENLGNFGWYIFVMLCLYILFGISFFISHKAASGRKALITGALILTVLSILFMLLLCYKKKKKKWFYDTILIFCAGSWYSVFKDKAETFLESGLRYTITCVICLILYAVTAYFRDFHFVLHELFMLCFTAAVILITVKISIKGKILDFFGSLAFPMFMFQGLPFIVFSRFNIQSSPYLFVILTFSVSVILSFLYKKISEVFSRKAF